MKYIVTLLLLLSSYIVANDKVSVQLNWKHQFEFAGFYMAKEKGFYDEVNLDVEIKEYQHGIDVRKSVLNGDATFGVYYSAIIKDIVEGKKLTLLKAFLQSSPHALITLKDGSINTFNDFEGKTIAVTSNTLEHVPLRAMLLYNDVNINKLKTIPHKYNTDDLVNKEVDMMDTFTTNEPFELKKKNIEYTTWDPKDYGFDFYDSLLFTSNKFLNENNDQTQRFIQATIKGWEYAYKNIQESIEIIQAKYNSQNKSYDHLEFEALKLKELAFYNNSEFGKIDEKKINHIIHLYHLLGQIKAKADISNNIYNTSFQNIKEKIKNTQFSVCIKPNMYPLAGEKDGDATGIFADLFKEIATDNNLNYKYKFFEDFEDFEFSVLADACDIVFPFRKDQKRFNNFQSLSIAPLKSYLASLGNKDSIYFDDYTNFDNKVFYVRDPMHLTLLEKYYPNVKTIFESDIEQILVNIRKNKNAHYVNQQIQLQNLISQNKDDDFIVNGRFHKLKVSNPTILVHKDHQILLEFFNNKIEKLDDTIRQIIDSYAHKKNIIYKTDYTIIYYLVLIMFLLILFITWQGSQKKLIQKQANELEILNKYIDKFLIVSETDLDGRIIDVSEAFEKISKYKKEELIGKMHSIVRHPDMPKSLYKELWETISQDKIWNGEIKNRRKDGSIYWVLSHISPKYDENNQKIGYISFRIDITDKKENEQKQLMYFEQAKMASLGEMIGNIAHQWRQPLAAIRTAATGIKLQKDYGVLEDKTFDEMVEIISNSTSHLSHTINVFRDFIKGDTDKRIVNLCEIVDGAINISKISLHNKEIVLNNTITKEFCNDKYTKTSIALIEQVFVNIVNNAMDILEEKQVKNPEIIVSSEIVKDKLHINIEDNGGGVPVNIINKIFEPYFTTKHQSQGTGLGLNMSYRIMNEALDGNLFVTNTQKGAKFTIELPLYKGKIES